jgi:hypothetical protein
MMEVKRVRVRPFLVAQEHLLSELALERLPELCYRHDIEDDDFAILKPRDAGRLVEAFGFRMATDAEFEYVARAGGVERWCCHPSSSDFDSENALGICQLISGQGEWVADGIHRGGHTQIQDRAEKMTWHAAFKEPVNPKTEWQRGGIRFALSLP